ncbi:HD domain-containing phosphohydrolase [Oscillochloris sp. ZM17-4]|uniref:HD domain-containing phosphohydrolase n=1 Tax=Oscillochloris sp. ZM17-4 TaxID=2866714 RepID=UPI0021029F2D|nr:HD domain-containing phosphohydrolase [Oscillochloris sp. ZM17-4]
MVDDQEINLQLLKRILQHEGFTSVQSLSDPYQALSTYIEYQPDIILLDLMMPGLDGITIMQLLNQCIPEGVYLPILVLTADMSPETRRHALSLGAKDFLTKPFDPTEVVLRIQNLLETRRLYLQLQTQNHHLSQQVQRGLRDIDEAQTEVILRLSQAAEYRDEETGLHTQRVGRLSALIARSIGLDEEQVELIRRAAPLHDIGKIAIPDYILRKPGRLTAEELRRMQEHAAMGARMLEDSRFPLLQAAHEIALYHHERWDGAGYPQGIGGHDIPIMARIVAVADAFDALTHERPYKHAWSVDETLTELRACSGSRYDPQVIEALNKVVIQEGLYRPGMIVSLGAIYPEPLPRIMAAVS